VGERQGLEFSLLVKPGRMKKTDWIIALAMTLAYGILSFSFAGVTTAPQTFWRATSDPPHQTFDLGEEVLLDSILYYAGLENRVMSGWTLELSVDGDNWREQPSMLHSFFDVFTWKIPFLEEGLPIPVRYIRLTATEDWVELGELVLLVRDAQGNRIQFDTTRLSERYPDCAALFDEQSLAPALPDQGNNDIYRSLVKMGRVPGKVSDQFGGPIFDETSHARAAYEYIRGIEPVEMTHPPLGKIIIAIGINLFGLTPFGWRVMGILMGMLMAPIIYVLLKNIFDNTRVAAIGAALLIFENLHFTQSRLATIDTPLVFFVLLMYLFMYRFISSGYEAPFKKAVMPLFLCGFSFGLGAATKWSAFYSALGLLVLFVVYLVKRGQHQVATGEKEQYRDWLIRTLVASVAFFIIIPFVIYTLSYIPIAAARYGSVSVSSLLKSMWESQAPMFAHHSDPARDAGHLYSSSWWMWMLDVRPMFYYASIQEGSRTFVGALTNPLVTIGGLAAIGFAALDAFQKRAGKALFIVVGYMAGLLPWLFVSRATFVYHYYPSVIFLILALCYVFDNTLKKDFKKRKRIYIFTGISAGIFFVLFPLSAGLTIPDWYSIWFVRWLQSWPF